MLLGEQYELLAIDLDGTLLDDRHKLPSRNRAALHAAHEAGLRVVVCTGRCYTETRPILEDIGLDLDAAITVGGALLTEVATGRTLHAATIELDLAREAADWFAQRNFSVMWLHDAYEVGFDGYVIQTGPQHPAIDRWLEITPCEMRPVDQTPIDGRPPLRVNVLDSIDALHDVAIKFQQHFDRRMAYNVIRVPTYDFTVLEAFAAGVDKWTGIVQLCERWGVDVARTIAIGDDVNDVPMIRSAGLGVAVANALPEVLAVARRHVSANVACGVAELIDELLLARKGGG